jgi:hypothetical protein
MPTTATMVEAAAMHAYTQFSVHTATPSDMLRLGAALLEFRLFRFSHDAAVQRAIDGI